MEHVIWNYLNVSECYHYSIIVTHYYYHVEKETLRGWSTVLIIALGSWEKLVSRPFTIFCVVIIIIIVGNLMVCLTWYGHENFIMIIFITSIIIIMINYYYYYLEQGPTQALLR
jgi:hypothetical protein